MEAHLGRPRKSSSSSQKRSSKDSSSSSHSSTSGHSSSHGHTAQNTASTDNTNTTTTSNVSQRALITKSCSLSNSSGSSDSSSRPSTTNHRTNNNGPPTRVSGSVSHSSSVLLGSFGATHNLSSPDTGYSTDGYSPKSAYPGLSFESCGKSTPKSSYTISSLVSCESSKPHSMSNGLDTEDCLSKDSCPGSCDQGSPGNETNSVQNHEREEEKDEISDLRKKSNYHRSSYAGNPKMSNTKSLEPLPEDKCQSNEEPVNLATTETHSLGPNRIPSPWLNSPQLSNNNYNNSASKNGFSVCSPSRKERPRIRTNPWITMSPLPKHINHTNGPKAAGEQANHSQDGKSCEKEDIPLISSTIDDRTKNSNNPNTGFRISSSSTGTTTDSGKGSSYDPECNGDRNSAATTIPIITTNRISMASTVLLSDSQSTRNSIISCTESEIGCEKSSSSSAPSNKHLLVLSPEYKKADPSVISVHSKSNSAVPTDRATNTNSYALDSGEKPKGADHKETDILSDWTTNTDEDPDMDTGMSLSSCADDTDTGCRAMRFSSSQSNSTSVSAATNTDLELISDTNLTTTYCASVASSSSNNSHLYYYYNNNKEGKKRDSTSSSAASSGVFVDPVCNMNLPTTVTTVKTCYPTNRTEPFVGEPTLQIPNGISFPPTLYNGAAQVVATRINQTEPVHANTMGVVVAQQQQLIPVPTFNANNFPHYGNSRYTGADDYAVGGITKTNKNDNDDSRLKSSHGLARGALGFIKKIFKKGSCSSHQNAIGSPKFKPYECRDKYAPTVQLPHAGIYGKGRAPSPTLAYPLSNRKTIGSNINNSFLTPTPNAFRRRSTATTSTLGSHHGGPSSSAVAATTSEGRHHSNSTATTKSIKTDIIRLPGTPEPHPQSFIQQHSKQLLQSSSESFRTTGESETSQVSNTGRRNTNGAVHKEHLNSTATNSSLNSSSMSTASSSSTCTASSGDSSRSHRRAQRKSSSVHKSHNYHHESVMQSVPLEDSCYSNPISPSAARNHSTKNPSHYYYNNNHGSSNNCQPSPRRGSTTIHPNAEYTMNLSPKPALRHSTAASPCPYDSPLLQNTGRMQSPSVNNYSPIHRLVVTGGTHLLNTSNRPPLPPVLPPPNNSNSQYYGSHHNEESPVPYKTRTPNSGHILHPTQQLSSHHKNGAPIINRPVHHNGSTNINTTNGGSVHSPTIHHNGGRYYDQQDGGVRSGSPDLSGNTNNANNFAWASPSPVLRNPRYQYITSSNQNSPVLSNAPRRLAHQNSGGGDNNHVNTGMRRGQPHGSARMITFSPKNGHGQHFCENGSPNVNHLRQGMKSPMRGYQHTESQNYQHQHDLELEENSSHRQNHYYASSMVPVKSLNLQESHGRFDRQQQMQYSNGIVMQRRGEDRTAAMVGVHSNLEASTDQIYESVDSVIEGVKIEPDNSDDGDGNGGDFEIDIPMRQARVTPSLNLIVQKRAEDGNEYYSSHVGGNKFMSASQHDFKSRRSKGSYGESSNGIPLEGEQEGRRRKIRPFDAFPSVMMTQLGTPLSETETRLLEADNETDLRYKRLINEAESLLREISVQKGNQERSNPSEILGVSSGVQRQQQRRHQLQTQIHEEFCPQSDPLRRKVYF